MLSYYSIINENIIAMFVILPVSSVFLYFPVKIKFRELGLNREHDKSQILVFFWSVFACRTPSITTLFNYLASPCIWNLSVFLLSKHFKAIRSYAGHYGALQGNASQLCQQKHIGLLVIRGHSWCYGVIRRLPAEVVDG
jgi:hypothetical protein